MLVGLCHGCPWPGEVPELLPYHGSRPASSELLAPWFWWPTRANPTLAVIRVMWPMPPATTIGPG